MMKQYTFLITLLLFFCVSDIQKFQMLSKKEKISFYDDTKRIIVNAMNFNDESTSTLTSHPINNKTFGQIFSNHKLILIDSSFSFTEGASTDKFGNVFFTDQPNNKIWKYDTEGKLSVFMSDAGRSNGTYFDKEGNLITCADEHDELWKIDTNKKVTVLIKDFNGFILNGPNDLWIDPKGGIYLTDPYFQRDYWAREQADSGLHGEHVYYLSSKQDKLILVDSTVKKPNGIIGTPDGKYLYVADMKPWKTYRYIINSDGSLSNKTLFINEASDGMTVDGNGNIYITGKGVTVYNNKGKKIDHIDVPEQWTANLCFGGKNKTVLFITASKSLYKIETNAKGIE